MRAKYILFGWCWPIASMLLFVAAMCCLIHEGAFHNAKRIPELYWAMFAVLITFLNGVVSLVISGVVTNTKPIKIEKFVHPKGKPILFVNPKFGFVEGELTGYTLGSQQECRLPDGTFIRIYEHEFINKP